MSEATGYYLVGPGTVSYANPGVLEQVAERRLKNGWGIDPDVNPADYDLLGGTVSCSDLGRSGYLVTEKEVRSILVVDCENIDHQGQMEQRQLLVDVNDESLVHKTAYLVLRRVK